MPFFRTLIAMLLVWLLALPAEAEAAGKRRNVPTTQQHADKAKQGQQPKQAKQGGKKKEMEQSSGSQQQASPSKAGDEPKKDERTTQKDDKGKADGKAADNASNAKEWTAEDVQKMCARTSTGQRSQEDCMERNARRIGRPKTPYDASLIGE